MGVEDLAAGGGGADVALECSAVLRGAHGVLGDRSCASNCHHARSRREASDLQGYVYAYDGSYIYYYTYIYGFIYVYIWFYLLIYLYIYLFIYICTVYTFILSTHTYICRPLDIDIGGMDFPYATLDSHGDYTIYYII